MLAEFTDKNSQALKILVEEHGVQIKRLPQEVLDHLEAISEKLVAEQGQANELSKRIYASYLDFKNKSGNWKNIGQTL